MNSARKGAKAQPWHVEISAGVRATVDSHCIGLADGLEPMDNLDNAVDGGLQHICQKNGHLFEREVLSAGCLIESPEAYFEFPVASILAPTNLSKSAEKALISVDQHFDSSTQKRQVLDSVVKAMQSKGLSRTLVEDISAVSDEFFTNAIFNAPFVDMYTHKNPGISRNHSEVKLEGGKQARLFMAHDESRLLIGCQDPYGSLDLKRYLKKIRAAYQRGPAATMNFGPGGAGIGSYIIFNAGSSLYFGVQPGQATILCCIVPLGMSNRQRIQLPKHLHWIQR